VSLSSEFRFKILLRKYNKKAGKTDFLQVRRWIKIGFTHLDVNHQGISRHDGGLKEKVTIDRLITRYFRNALFTWRLI